MQDQTKLSIKDILSKIECGEISANEGEELLKNNASQSPTIFLKLSEKGCISIYGLRKMPISLYPEELNKILNLLTSDFKPSKLYEKFLEDNRELLKVKVKKIFKKRDPAPI